MRPSVIADTADAIAFGLIPRSPSALQHAMTALRLAHAEARIELLEEENRRLRDHLDRFRVLARRFGLPPRAGQMFSALVAGPLSRTRAMALLYGLDDEAPGEKVLDVWICRIRRALRERDMGLDTIGGVGWDLPDETRARLLALAGEEEVLP